MLTKNPATALKGIETKTNEATHDPLALPKNPATALKGIETSTMRRGVKFSLTTKNPATALKGIETLENRDYALRLDRQRTQRQP